MTMATSWLQLCSLLLFIQVISGLRFPAVGDWGDYLPIGMENQKLVADQMNNWCTAKSCDFIFSTGDNFYPQGVTSPNHTRFDLSWKNVYTQPNLADKVWYMSIGNHDHDGDLPSDGREWNQVLYGMSEPRWYFPNRWYDFVVQDPAGFSVHFVVIDSQSLKWGINDPDAQLQWLDDAFAASTSEWRVLVLHHPPYTVGNHGPVEATMDSQVVPIVKRRKVQLVVSGHDHNLQHIGNATNVNEVDYVISGAGGVPRYVYRPSSAEFLINRGFVIRYFGFVHGFTGFEFTADQVTVEYVDSEGNLAYSFSRGLSTDSPRVD